MDTVEGVVDTFVTAFVAALDILLNALLSIIGGPLIQTILDLFGQSS